MSEIKLTPFQKDILIFFGKHPFGKNFYWTGGTLLSWRYLKHRLSVDLDFFSDNLYSDDDYLIFINVLKKEFKAQKIALTSQLNRRVYIIKRGSESLKIELVFFPFPAIEKRKNAPEFSLKVDSLTDIMVNKVLAAYQRNEPKDVFDLYCYLNANPKYDLLKLIDLVEKKFGVSIEPVILLSKINELTDALNSLSPLLVAPQKNLAKKVKIFFQEIFNSIAKKQIK